MKNTLVLLFLAASPDAHAQLEKGNLMVGGTGSFGFGGGGNGFTGSVGLQPRAGLFITDRLVLGAGIGLGLSTYRVSNEDRVTSYSGSIQPFARYYFAQKTDKPAVPKSLVPFAEVGLGAGAIRHLRQTYTGTNSYAMLGVNKFFNEHVALEFNLSYNRSSYGLGTPLRQGPIGGGIGLQIFLDRGKSNTSKITE